MAGHGQVCAKRCNLGRFEITFGQSRGLSEFKNRQFDFDDYMGKQVIEFGWKGPA